MRQINGVLSAGHRLASFVEMRTQCGRVSPNLSLNPDASPAALARRPLGAG